jgi:hypothetical protein
VAHNHITLNQNFPERLLDLLGSGQPLTISAEGKSYVLPPAKVPRWRARFQKIC